MSSSVPWLSICLPLRSPPSFSPAHFFSLSHFRYFSQLENSLDFVLEDGKGLFAHHAGLFRDFSLSGVNAERFEALCLPSTLPSALSKQPSPLSLLSPVPPLLSSKLSYRDFVQK